MGEAIVGVPNFPGSELNLDRFTWGLLKHIPLDINSMILSGELLFDAYYTHIHHVKPPHNVKEQRKINLFLIGSINDKIKKTSELIENLEKAYAKSNVTVFVNNQNANTIYIRVANVRKLIEIVCTDCLKLDDLTNSFDFAHEAIGYTNEGFHASLFAKMSIQSKQVYPNIKCTKRAKVVQLIKWKDKGMDISPYIKEFPFNRVEKNNTWYNDAKNKVETIIDIKNLDGLVPFDWSGHGYLDQGIKEGLDSNKLKVGVIENIYTNLNCTSYVFQGNFKDTKNMYSSLLVKGNVKSILSLKQYPDFLHYMILGISDHETIELVKCVVKKGIKRLEIISEEKSFYYTGILNSNALDQDEKEFFNVMNFPFDKYPCENINQEIAKCAESNDLCLFMSIFRDNPEVNGFINRTVYEVEFFADLNKKLKTALDNSEIYVSIDIANHRKGALNLSPSEKYPINTTFTLELVL